MERVEAEDGVFQHAFYQDESRDDCLRVIQLELKGETLNGYLSSSSCDGERTRADRAQAQAILSEGAQLSKADLERRMGPPSGRFLCPSRLNDNATGCTAGAVELWHWMTAPDRPPPPEKRWMQMPNDNSMAPIVQERTPHREEGAGRRGVTVIRAALDAEGRLLDLSVSGS